ARVRVRSRAATAAPVRARRDVGADGRRPAGRLRHDGAGQPARAASVPEPALLEDRAELQEARSARRVRRLVAREVHGDRRHPVRGLGRHRRGILHAGRSREGSRNCRFVTTSVDPLDRDALFAAADRGTLWSFWAAQYPDRVAIRSVHGDRTLAAVDGHANQLARARNARGVAAGDGIALLCANRPEFVESSATAQRSGLRLTTINWHLTGEEAGYIVDDCEATAFVADARFAEAAHEAAARAPRLKAKFAVGGEIPGFESYD